MPLLDNHCLLNAALGRDPKDYEKRTPIENHEQIKLWKMWWNQLT